jgi:hypothetical protein
MKIIKESDITYHNGWISIKSIGTIGIYGKPEKAILLDYSMKWIVGTNSAI